MLSVGDAGLSTKDTATQDRSLFGLLWGHIGGEWIGMETPHALHIHLRLLEGSELCVALTSTQHPHG